MAHVDALSRAPVCHLISDNDLLTVTNRDLATNSKYKTPVNAITNVEQIVVQSERSEFITQTGGVSTILQNGRELKVVPPSLVLRVIEDSHDKSGHPGIKKTYRQIHN